MSTSESKVTTLKTYLPLVREQARTFSDRRARTDELERYGLMGLMKAIEMFDPDRAIPFEAFAKQRIRGAMSDYLRTVAAGRAHAGTTPVPAMLLDDIGSDVPASRAASMEIWRSIEALPPNQKLIIGLHYCEAVTLKDVGRILGITEREAELLRNQALHSVHTHLSLRSWLDGNRRAEA
ncbi:MAG TPA: sigma-70 family RNA polymerase sigma factor [bacterium]|nr:sigma-70 family RNA polymerase sigma factor [bacterium]